MEVRTVVPVAAVPVQIAEAVTATIASTRRSQTVTVVKNLTVQRLDAGTAEMKEAAGNETQPEKKKTRRPKETETEIVLGTGMAIKKRRESATETKIDEKETANETGTVTGIGIDIAGMIKTATGMSEKSETQLLEIFLPVVVSL